MTLVPYRFHLMAPPWEEATGTSPDWMVVAGVAARDARAAAGAAWPTTTRGFRVAMVALGGVQRDRRGRGDKIFCSNREAGRNQG
jgi:hypothetical protein